MARPSGSRGVAPARFARSPSASGTLAAQVLARLRRAGAPVPIHLNSDPALHWYKKVLGC